MPFLGSIIRIIALILFFYTTSFATDKPQIYAEISDAFIYIYTTDLKTYVFDEKLFETVKAGIPKRVTFLISLLKKDKVKDQTLSIWQVHQDIRYDVWEEEFQITLWDGTTRTYSNKPRAFSKVSTLEAVQLPRPQNLTQGNVFWIVVSFKIEPFSKKEKRALESWVSPERGKGISLQDVLNFFLNKGIKTTEKKFVIKSPMYKID